MKEDLNILIKDKSDTGILRLVMNNSDQRNPLSENMMSALMDEIKEASSDKSTRVIVLAAIGNVFSSGHDLKEITTARENQDDGEDYFVHVYGLGPKLRKFGLIQGQRVAFDIDFDMKGDKAINVRPGKQS